jgi:signal transduction histidine kinase
MGGMGQRLILADVQGKVIADTATSEAENLSGSQLSADELSGGTPVRLRQTLVGTLIVTLANIITPSNPASRFLTSVNRSILVSVLVASLISLFVVVFIFFEITAPIRRMQKAAGEIASGDLSQRVLVNGGDELGQLAQAFNHMASSLASAEAQRKNLLADVAHELRTPLSVIQANTEALQDGVLPLNLEQVDAIHNETLLLARLVNDLRLISLAEAGELHLQRQVVDPADLLKTVLERYQAQCSQKGVGLAIEAEENLPQVRVDVDRIIQVLNNLVSNALRNTPESGKIILRAQQPPLGEV